MNAATMTALMTGAFVGFGLMANSVPKVQAVELSQTSVPTAPTIYNSGFPNNGYPNPSYVYPPAGQPNTNSIYGYPNRSYGYPNRSYGYPYPIIYVPYPIYVYPTFSQPICSSVIMGSPIPSPVPINQSTGQFCR